MTSTSHRSRTWGGGHKLAWAVGLTAGLVLLATPLAAGGDEPATPDTFQASSSAAGVTYVQLKQPNPLPVGPGAFATIAVPEAAGVVDQSNSIGRGSIVYPGNLIVGAPALLCLAGVPPACTLPPFATVAEAQYPVLPDARAETDKVQYQDPTSPIRVGVGQAEGHARLAQSSSRAKLSTLALEPPAAAQAAVLDALDQTLAGIPGATRGDDTALVSVGGMEVTQRILPVEGGVIEIEANALLSDVRLLAGVVLIDGIRVTATAASDGKRITKATSTTKYSGASMAGFAAVVDGGGIHLAGSDNRDLVDGLNAAGAAVGDAVHTALEKLSMTLRSGTATKTVADGAASSAADGLVVSIGTAPLTDQSPPQPPPELCAPINEIQNQLATQAPDLPRLPPICVVPDATGTRDTYSLVLGQAAAAITASAFDVFDDGIVGGDVALPDVGAPTDDGAGLGLDVGGGGGGLTDLPASAPGPTIGGRQTRLVFDEARWLGDLSLETLYLALAGLAVAMIPLSRLLLSSLSERRS